MTLLHLPRASEFWLHRPIRSTSWRRFLSTRSTWCAAPICPASRGNGQGLIPSGLRLESSVVFNRPSAVSAHSILADYPSRVGRSGSRRKMQFNSSALRIMPAKPENASQFGNSRPKAGSRPIRRSRIVIEKFVGLSSHDRGYYCVSHVARRPMAKRRVESNDARIPH